jgi:hypothetical protein
MSRLSKLAVIMATLGIVCVSLAQRAPKVPIVDVQSPSIVAFFPSTSTADLANPDTNETLSDFQLYAQRVRQPLSEAGINFREVYANAFVIRVGTKTTTVHPRIEVGYYFAAPGKKPRIEYGVMTDADLLHAAAQYFDTTRLRDKYLR